MHMPADAYATDSTVFRFLRHSVDRWGALTDRTSSRTRRQNHRWRRRRYRPPPHADCQHAYVCIRTRAAGRAYACVGHGDYQSYSIASHLYRTASEKVRCIAAMWAERGRVNNKYIEKIHVLK